MRIRTWLRGDGFEVAPLLTALRTRLGYPTVRMLATVLLASAMCPAFQQVSPEDGKRLLKDCAMMYGRGELQKALAACKGSLQFTKAAGVPRVEATTLNIIGNVHSALGEKQKALQYYEQALPIAKAVGDRRLEATTLTNIGEVHSALGEKQRALEDLQQALPIERAIGDRQLEATTLNIIGIVHSDLGEKQKALQYYEQALPIAKAVGDRRVEATTLNNIGEVHSALGEKRRALQYYEQALPIAKAVSDRRAEAVTLNNIGAAYSDLGDKQRALQYYEESLPIAEAIGDWPLESMTLNNIGVVHFNLGEPKKALQYYERALTIAKGIGDQRAQAMIVSNKTTATQPTLLDSPSAVTSLLFKAFWLFGLILSSVTWLWHRWKRRGWTRWPIAEGHIETRSIIQDQDGSGRACRLGYSYSVKGEYFSGFAQTLFKSEAQASAFRNQVKDRQRVLIRYSPSDPNISVLDLQTLELDPPTLPEPDARTNDEPQLQLPQPIDGLALANGSSVAQAIGEMTTLPSLTVDYGQCPPDENETTLTR